MRRRPTRKDWLPLVRTDGGAVEAPTGEAFRTEWIDFERGIRVGNLEPHERITRILKYRLEEEYGTGFVTDRWGRGVYWQWICWVPRADRDAKPISSRVNFGCAKLFISQDRAARVFQCGLQVERGAESAEYRGAPAGDSGAGGVILQDDWDWHRLMGQCAAHTPLDEELRRLVRGEGFVARIWGWPGAPSFTAENYRSAGQIREAARKAPRDGWAGFQLYYPMPEPEVRSTGGYDFVQAIMGAFSEVVPAMNLCMQVTLASVRSLSVRGRGSAIPSGTAPDKRPPASGR
jgi:hypothetical protein